MEARKIRVIDMTHESELRSTASPNLFVDVTGPEVAYLCSRCGAAIAFAMEDMPISGKPVQCGICEATSTI